MDINTGILTVVVGLLGILSGSLISPRISQRLNQEYSRKDIFFKKKLEYFERVAECMERNIRLYKNSIRMLEDGKEVKEILETMKHERKNFLLLSSPIYFKTFELSQLIRKFTGIEKNIFEYLEMLKKDKKTKEKIITNLKENLDMLRDSGNKIIIEIKRDIREEI